MESEAKAPAEGLALLIAKKATAKASESYPGEPGFGNESSDDEALDIAADDVASAMQTGSPRKVAQALKSFIELCK